MKKYCIFDLDGTLLNTLSTITYYLNGAITPLGATPVSEEECKYFIGDGAANLVRRALTSRGLYSEESFPDILKSYKNAYDSAPLYLTEPYPGITELIDWLCREGVTLAVLSNKPNEATVAVVREFFGDKFAYVQGGMDKIPLKPSPEAPLRLASLMGANPCEVAFIGDTAVDIETAKNMGAALAVGVSWGFRSEYELKEAGADVIVASPSLLYEVLK
jgi:phosphoglycolate phosphatase